MSPVVAGCLAGSPESCVVLHAVLPFDGVLTVRPDLAGDLQQVQSKTPSKSSLSPPNSVQYRERLPSAMAQTQT